MSTPCTSPVNASAWTDVQTNGIEQLRGGSAEWSVVRSPGTCIFVRVLAMAGPETPVWVVNLEIGSEHPGS